MDQLSVDPRKRPHQNIISVYAVIDWILFPTPTVISGLILSRYQPSFAYNEKKEHKDDDIRIVVFQSYQCFFHSYSNVKIRSQGDRNWCLELFRRKKPGLFFYQRHLIVNKYCLFLRFVAMKFFSTHR